VVSTPRSSIIIPVFNQAVLTRRCLDGVLDKTRSDNEIIVVDDGSSDLTSRLLDSYGDRLLVVHRPSQSGYATACNMGAARANSEHLVFLNNDTVVTDGWLDQLIDHATRHPGAAIVGAKLLFGDHSIQHAGVVIAQNRMPYHIYKSFPGDHPVVNISREYQAVTGACVLVRREVFVELGGFDTEFRNGLEDIDLCLRARVAGHEVRYCHQSVVFHLEAATRDWTADAASNADLFLDRWSDRIEADDVRYYIDDGLLDLFVDGTDVIVEISPLLGRARRAGANNEAERVLDVRSRQIQVLRAEAESLREQLAARANGGAPTVPLG
jgi:GT2 family glycosyltransferase